MSRPLPRAAGTVLFAFLIILGRSPSGSAETMRSALVQAYQNNPQLNAQRANARAIDENVPQALSGYRPKLSITATAGEQYTDTVTKANSQGVNTYQHAHGTTSPWTAGGT